MEELKQQKNFQKIRYRLSDTKIYYYTSSYGSSDEVEIPYENISGDKISLTKSSNPILLISVVFYLITIALIVGFIKGSEDIEVFAPIFWGMVASFFLFLYFYTKQHLWKIQLSNNKYLLFHKKIPNEKRVENFISSLIKRRNEYLKDTYGIVDANLNYQDQLQNYRWLRTMGAISKTEFEELYSSLKKISQPDKNHIGFSNKI